MAGIIGLKNIAKALGASGSIDTDVEATINFLKKCIDKASNFDNMPDCYHTTFDEVLAEDGVLEDLVQHPKRKLLYERMSHQAQDRVREIVVAKFRLQIDKIIQEAVDKVAKEIVEDGDADDKH